MAIYTEFAAPSSLTPTTTRTPSPTPRERETPSPPAKRQRGRSTPPPSPAVPSPLRRRSSSTPPGSPTSPTCSTRGRGERGSSTPQGSPTSPSSSTRGRAITEQRGNCQPSPVAIFWDIENCPVPNDCDPQDVCSHVMKALGEHHNFSGPVIKFCACGDFNRFKSRVKEGLLLSGVEVVQCSKKKEAADKVILVEMIFFATDSGLPLSVLLISSDGDFALALQRLRKRKYIIGVAIRSAVHLSTDLTMHSEVVWDWPSLAHGKGAAMARPLACPGDLQALKADMVQLLKSTRDGYIKAFEIPGAYVEQFLRPLVLPYYGVSTLSNLFRNLGQDSFLMYGGQDLCVSLNVVPALAIDDDVPKSLDGSIKDKEMALESVDVGARSEVTIVPVIKPPKKCRNVIVDDVDFLP